MLKREMGGISPKVFPSDTVTVSFNLEPFLRIKLILALITSHRPPARRTRKFDAAVSSLLLTTLC
ncbi:hypothetical protein SAMN05444745_11133 [Arthrobacter sp. OV608]|nr:hypothetical protein SAMN05444745_11133 [Arthrobacter sp. OV608]